MDYVILLKHLEYADDICLLVGLGRLDLDLEKR